MKRHFCALQFYGGGVLTLRGAVLGTVCNFTSSATSSHGGPVEAYRMSTRKQNLSAEEVRELFDYDPDTGLLYWKHPKQGRKTSRIAGGKTPSGGISVCISYVDFEAHRLIWLWVHGEWPPFGLQHKNGVRDDNRLVNLVERDHSLAQINRKTPSRRGRSGFLGVSRIGGNPDDRKYVANITVKGKHHFLGSFNDPSEAHQAYLTAKHELLTASPQHRES